jgi:hypothetical protein
LAAVFVALVLPGLSAAATVKQRTFASPEEAMKAMGEALKSHDVKALEAIFGPGSKDLISSGDPVADRTEYDRIVNHLEQKTKLEVTEDKTVLILGSEEWPFAIPIVKKDSLWHFDTKKGREEILARRIGKNELSAIQFCLAYVDAQREYALVDWTGDGFLEYAQKFFSDPGKKNGLYWEVKAGEKPSPLGPLAAEASKQGYAKTKGKASPYHGYYFRILKAQGKSAPGGAYDFMARGKMIGGFALVAYPAKYASSGIMTFIVNHDGVVYQKNLGPKTGKLAQAIKIFDPDGTWEKVQDKDLKAEGN